MSKQATAGTSGSSRGHGVEPGEGLRLVQRREGAELLEGVPDRRVDHGGPGEPGAAVDDPVAHRVGRRPAVEQGRQVVAGHTVRSRLDVRRLLDGVVPVEQAELEAGRAGVDDEDPAHSQVHPEIAGSSSPCSRV